MHVSHVLALLAAPVAMAFVNALAGQPQLDGAALGHALGAALLVAVGILLKSPIQDPGVKP